MKIGIMQPYFFPYLGYFSLIKHTENFILLDAVQFMRHGWIERNRILKPQQGWQYIKVPLEKHSRSTIIKDIEIKVGTDWEEKIFRQLNHYKKRAPYYNETIEVVEKAVNIETKSIVKLNKNILELVCDYVDIKRDIKIFSELELNISPPKAPDEWALNICKEMEGVDQYWNPEGGIKFFDKQKYLNSGIDVKFTKIDTERYPQRRKEFEGDLSIIDVMMFNEPEKINNMLDNYIFLD